MRKEPFKFTLSILPFILVIVALALFPRSENGDAQRRAHPQIGRRPKLGVDVSMGPTLVYPDSSKSGDGRRDGHGVGLR